MKRVVFIIFILVPFCFAYSNIDDDKRIKGALLKYNYGIIKMTKSGNTKLLKDMLSRDIYEKLMVWADAWKFSNLAMVAKINDLRFSPIAYNENNATIRTLENWTYGYANLIKKDYALKPRNMFYKMHYTLEKQADKWMIVAIKVIEEEEFQNKKEEPKEDIATH